MKWVKFLLAAVFCTSLFYVLQFPIGQTPAVGNFLNPFGGFWQNNTRQDELFTRYQVQGLKAEVKVVWDERQVAHVFAENDHDLYMMQGYLTARDRLWQMDFIARAAGGRLSEVVGERALELDRFRRRTGMVYAAENSLAATSDAQSKLVMEAYAKGVNRWIATLTPDQYPLEFKILNYQPEAWTPLKSALVLKYMAWDLTGRNDELQMTRTRQLLGDSLMNEMFFKDSDLQRPIIPRNTAWPFEALSPPPAPESLVEIEPLAMNMLLSPDPDIGSNNWAVSGEKTKSGHAILCNDPHLALRLPAIWYEIQLHAPGVNVYGTSIPGAPAVIIGFNENISWGVTNAATDVMDWYEIEFRDDAQSEYLYDGEWLQAKQRLETIHVLNGASIVDTIPMTRFGPLVYNAAEKSFSSNVPTGMALRWTAHQPSNELRTFLHLNRATDYDTFTHALSFFDCPAQNFVYADNQGNIAIHHNGKFPVRWQHQGRYISDGRDPAYDWKEYIPREHLPKVKNPEQGFVFSANQRPTDMSYPYYLGARYATFERSMRIHERLNEMQNITVEDMMVLQKDNQNLRAEAVLPIMLDVLEMQGVSLAEARDMDLLRSWDFSNERDEVGPLIFDTWWSNFHALVWEDEVRDQDEVLSTPVSEVTVNLLLSDTASIWFDRRDTAERERLGDILSQSFAETSQQLTEKHGLFGDDWQWGKARGTDILHMAQIPGMGRTGLETNGNRAIVNATSKRFGPSWRMIVEMGPEIRAWGIYPGGQSGNPGSQYYDNMIDDWVAGEYYPIVFLKSADEASEDIIGTSVFSNTLAP